MKGVRRLHGSPRQLADRNRADAWCRASASTTPRELRDHGMVALGLSVQFIDGGLCVKHVSGNYRFARGNAIAAQEVEHDRRAELQQVNSGSIALRISAAAKYS
jgi:hypothetical protein